jgi:Domain of unknown function (DUF4411)
VNAAGAHYSLDTSALIDGIERFYPIDNFPALWNRVDDLIKLGRLHVSEEAWNEAICVDSALKDWCTDISAGRDLCVVPTDAAIATVAGTIVQQFPQWIQQGNKNHADPFVIAVAEVRSACMVVSGETNGGPSKPKIPYVCGLRQVAHGKFINMVRAEGWVFG